MFSPPTSRVLYFLPVGNQRLVAGGAGLVGGWGVVDTAGSVRAARWVAPISLSPAVSLPRDSIFSRRSPNLSRSFLASSCFPEAFLMRSEEHTSELQSQSNLVCR